MHQDDGSSEPENKIAFPITGYLLVQVARWLGEHVRERFLRVILSSYRDKKMKSDKDHDAGTVPAGSPVRMEEEFRLIGW